MKEREEEMTEEKGETESPFPKRATLFMFMAIVSQRKY